MKIQTNNTTGVSLIELLIVMSILLILCFLAIPNYSAILANNKLNITAKQLVSDLRYCQQIAINQETNVQASFFRNVSGTTSDIYTIRVLENNIYQNHKTVHLPHDIQLIEAIFGLNQVRVSFSHLGRTNLNGHIKLENNRGEHLFVVIYQTGRIRITEKTP